MTRADEHVGGSYDVGNRMFPRVVSGDPDCDRDVVGGVTVSNGEGAMKTEQQLCSSVVVSWGEEDERWKGEGER